MNLKQFKWAKIAVAFILAFVIAQSVMLNSYLLAAIAIIIAVALILIMRTQVTEVLADERDYKIAGDTARWTLSIFSILGWLISFVLIALRQTHPEFENAGYILSYCICALLVTHMLVTAVYRRTDDTIPRRKKAAYFVISLIIAALFAIAALRSFSSEDDWVCQNGNWIQHGHPDSPAQPLTANDRKCL